MPSIRSSPASGKTATTRSGRFESMRKAAGGVFTAKQAPAGRRGTDFKSVLHGNAPAVGLRAGNDVPPFYRRPTWKGRTDHVIPSWLQNLRSAFNSSRHAPRDEPRPHHAER